MTLAGKIAALLRTLGLRENLSVSTALDTMEAMMGLESGGSWPDRADRLMSAVGVTLDGATRGSVRPVRNGPLLSAPGDFGSVLLRPGPRISVAYFLTRQLLNARD